MAGMRSTDEVTRPLRVDAERNRGRIVEAAQTEFAEHGLDVPLEDASARAAPGADVGAELGDRPAALADGSGAALRRCDARARQSCGEKKT